MGLPNPSREDKFSGANADREIFIFPCSADHKQDWQRYPVDPYSCYMCDHTYTYYIICSLLQHVVQDPQVLLVLIVLPAGHF